MDVCALNGEFRKGLDSTRGPPRNVGKQRRNVARELGKVVRKTCRSRERNFGGTEEAGAHCRRNYVEEVRLALQSAIKPGASPFVIVNKVASEKCKSDSRRLASCGKHEVRRG